MAVRVWLSTSNDWGSPAAWSGGAVPVTSDVVVFPATATLSPTVNLDQSLVSLSAMHIAEGCTINIGTHNSPLKLNPNSVQHSGLGDLHLFYPSAGVSTGKLWAVMGSPTAKFYVYNNCVDYVFAGKGQLIVEDSLSSINYLQVFALEGQSDTVVTLNNATASFVWVSGGTLNVSGTVTVIYAMSGGSVNVQNNGVLTTAYCMGGVINHASYASSVFYVVGSGGLIDTTSKTRPMTITEARVMSGGRLLYDPDMVTVTNQRYFQDIIGEGPVP